MSGCSQLSSKKSTINDAFSQLVPELSARYKALDEAITLTEDLGGERDVTREGKISLKKYTEATRKKNINGQMSAANELEIIIGRLHANASNSPRLKDSAELNTALVVVTDALPSKEARDRYARAVQAYEKSRQSFRNSASALFGGYSAPTDIAFWIPPETSS